MSRKRLYQLRYETTDEPIYIEDLGNLLKISGILLQGMGTTTIAVSPSGNIGTDAFKNIRVIKPPLDEWCEILRRTDDPLYFEQDETGTIKAIHRKAQRAISGAIQQQIWARDGFRCMLCGQPMGKVQLTVDHWTPLELGGINDASNYLSCCRSCNKLKGSRDPSEYCLTMGFDYNGICLYLEGIIPASTITHLT